MSTPIPVGQPAPDFTLNGWAHGEQSEYTLSARRGHAVVLAFYPADGTAVCTKQMCSYSDDLDVFTGLNAVVWGISTQDVDSKKDFAAKRNLNVPLLADPGNVAANSFGIVGKFGPKRSVFVINPDGNVAWSHVAMFGLGFQSAKKIAEVLRSLPSPTGSGSANS